MNNERNSSNNETPASGAITHRSQWIQDAYSAISLQALTQRDEDYCSLKCRIIQHKLALIYPNDLSEQSPDLLNYLNQFAIKNDLRLIQDRRICDLPPEEEVRKATPPVMALGVGLLLQKTGLTGEHNLQIPVERESTSVNGDQFKQLLAIGAKVEKSGKAVTLPTNRFLQENSGPKFQINGYASKITKGDESRIFSVFDSQKFRAISYAQRSNFVFNVFAGGGTLEFPEIWGPLANMTREPIQVRLYRDEEREHKYALFYSTYNLDLNHSTKQSMPE